MSKIKQENIELKEHIEYLETQLEKKQLEFKPVFKCSLKLIIEDRVQVIPIDKYIVDGDTAQFTLEIPNGHFGDQSKQISDLEAKLAEKEKEIENIKLCRCVNCTNEYEFMLEGLVEDLEKQIDKDDQDKISFALERLEKVKNYIVTDEKDMFGANYLMNPDYVLEFVDNQIEELKKEMK